MPRILPEPDMNLYEYVVEQQKGNTNQGMQYRHRVLRRRAEPIDPDPEPDGAG